MPLVAKARSAYKSIIEKLFFDNYQKGRTDFTFSRDEIFPAADSLGVARPKNPGDVIYTFRHRQALPEKVIATQPANRFWLILGAGDGIYRFKLSKLLYISPTPGLLVRKIPDATPGIIENYALSQEQALLAKIRYNRLIDTFLGLTAYSLQNHLRTKIANYGQIEIDELYVGVNSEGQQFVVPVQAKGGNDKLGVIQTIQDITYCREGTSKGNKYRDLKPRAVSAQFMADDVIALFELTFDGNDVAIVSEKHYRLTEPSEITADDLQRYSQ